MSNEISWPRYTCVACFVYKSLEQLGITTDPATIARAIDTKTPPGTDNPFSLETAEDPDEWGVKSDDAIISINRFFEKQSMPFIFQHIPLSIVPFQMFEELVNEILAKQIPVAIGYNYNDISKSKGINKHVSFIRKRKNVLVIEDFYDVAGGEVLNVSFDRIVYSSSAIDDGFWVIGHKNDFVFSFI